MPELRLLLVSGSLRGGSTSTAVLRTLAATAPDDVVAVWFAGAADLPHFNPDHDQEPFPAPVAELRSAIHRADAIVFSTPEYAGALPGSFKNLLDWCIGDDHPRSICGKPVAWINPSPRGARDAHESLRKVLSYAGAVVVEDACVEIPLTMGLVGADGIVPDPAARRCLAVVAAELERWVRDRERDGSH